MPAPALRGNAGDSPGDRLLEKAHLPAAAGERGPEVLVANDAERGIKEVPEDSGGETPVVPPVADELAGNA